MHFTTKKRPIHKGDISLNGYSEQLKTHEMKTNNTHKEILLVTNNSFAQREWCKKDEFKNNFATPQEQMEEICANGLINELLPEIFNTPDDKKLFLWEMHPGFSFVQLEYGEYPMDTDKYYALNPHYSLAFKNYN